MERAAWVLALKLAIGLADGANKGPNGQRVELREARVKRILVPLLWCVPTRRRQPRDSGFPRNKAGRLSKLRFSVRIRRGSYEEVAMSSSSESESELVSESGHWFDTWWPLLVILYGLLFVTVLVSFAPTI